MSINILTQNRRVGDHMSIERSRSWETDMVGSHGVIDHYGTTSLLRRVDEALRHAGLGDGRIEWAELAPLDQFHVRGLAATRELAEALGIDSGANLLDVGCGLGGPARFLAATYGCYVTGIDLSEPFVEAARMLTERSGLADKVSFLQADALDLPFADEFFDHAWTQHVAMNIADRAGFYAAIHRVLKPGGRLAIYDVVAGEGGPPTYPVPWARVPGISFLVTPEAMRNGLARAGFKELSWDDKTVACRAWADEVGAKRHSSPAPFGIHTVMGPEFAEMAGNLERNLREGRIRIVQTIVAKLRAAANRRRNEDHG
jgi:ubiquinone/menaquinone biosynthesis C-methylase UbiE